MQVECDTCAKTQTVANAGAHWFAKHRADRVAYLWEERNDVEIRSFMEGVVACTACEEWPLGEQSINVCFGCSQAYRSQARMLAHMVENPSHAADVVKVLRNERPQLRIAMLLPEPAFVVTREMYEALLQDAKELQASNTKLRKDFDSLARRLSMLHAPHVRAIPLPNPGTSASTTKLPKIPAPSEAQQHAALDRMRF